MTYSEICKVIIVHNSKIILQNLPIFEHLCQILSIRSFCCMGDKNPPPTGGGTWRPSQGSWRRRRLRGFEPYPPLRGYCLMRVEPRIRSAFARTYGQMPSNFARKVHWTFRRTQNSTLRGEASACLLRGGRGRMTVKFRMTVRRVRIKRSILDGEDFLGGPFDAL